MQLSIIIINYNTFTLTCNCIQSIYDKLTEVDFEIVLVDNASVECDPHLFTNKFPGIHLVISPVNSGFTGGNNLGADNAKGEYLLLLTVIPSSSTMRLKFALIICCNIRKLA